MTHPPQGPQYPPSGPMRQPYPQSGPVQRPMHGPQQMHYGPPQPPKKHWTATPWPWVALGAAVAIFAALWFGVIDKTPTLTTDAVRVDAEKVIRDNGFPEYATVDDLQCPTMTAEKGEKYTCTASVEDQKVRIDVTIQDDDGHYLLEVSSY